MCILSAVQSILGNGDLKHSQRIVYLNVFQTPLKQNEHFRQLVVRVYIVHGPATLLQQANDALILNLLMHLKLFERLIKGLQKSSEVIVVGKVGLGKLQEEIEQTD